MTTVSYDSKKPRFPDLSHYHPIVNAVAFKASNAVALGTKCNEGTYLDPTCKNHKAIAASMGIPFVAYDFSHGGDAPTFLKAVPPQAGVIPCLDAEASDLTLAEAEAWVNAVHSAWGRYPWVYGHSWLGGKAIAGTVIEKCPGWQPTYGSTLTVAGNPSPLVAWQFTDGLVGPTGSPRTWAGVAGHCDISMLVETTDLLRTQAGWGSAPPPPGGDDDMVPQDQIDQDAARRAGYTAALTGGDWHGNIPKDWSVDWIKGYNEAVHEAGGGPHGVIPIPVPNP